MTTVVGKIRNEESLYKGGGRGNDEEWGGSCEIFGVTLTILGIQLDSSHSNQYDLLKLLI